MGGIGSAIGIGSSLLGASKGAKGAKSAARAQERATEARIKADEEKLAFEREKYQDWQDTYGGIEDNLSEYYNSLTPEFFAVQGLEAFELEQDRALTNVRENLAQRGITDSGIAAQTEIDFASSGAVNRARIRAEAPQKSADLQQNFLRTGLSLSPGTSLSNALSSSASSAAQTEQAAYSRSDNASQSAGRAYGSAIGAVGTALDDYFNDDE